MSSPYLYDKEYYWIIKIKLFNIPINYLIIEYC